MTRTCVRNILVYLGSNVLNELETLPEARRFVRNLDGLSGDERRYLQRALKSKASIIEGFLAQPVSR